MKLAYNLRLMGRCIALIFLSLALYSCSYDSQPRFLDNPAETFRGSVELEQNLDGNFVFYVSNQSVAEPKVDIQVLIDGKIAINHNFRVSNHHNWIKFVFDLPQGIHTLKAVSSKGKAQLETEFVVGKQNWAVLDYWYSPKNQDKDRAKRRFSFHNQEEPITFV